MSLKSRRELPKNKANKRRQTDKPLRLETLWLPQHCGMKKNNAHKGK